MARSSDNGDFRTSGAETKVESAMARTDLIGRPTIRVGSVNSVDLRLIYDADISSRWADYAYCTVRRHASIQPFHCESAEDDRHQTSLRSSKPG